MPTIGQLEAVDFTGPRAASLADRFYYRADAAAGVQTAGGGLTAGDAYRLTAVEPATPDLAAIEAPGGLSEPAAAPESLRTWVDEHASGSGGAALAGLVALLRERGYLSHGLDAGVSPPVWMQSLPDYTFQPSASGHSLARIDAMFARLLERETDPRAAASENYVAAVGDDEQFATAVALIAHELGFPARVVVGARLSAADPDLRTCEAGVCRAQDLAAWTEVQSAAGEWVPVEVTPQHAQSPSLEVTEQRNPENVTEVRPDPVEDVVPPEPVQEDNGVDDGTDDAAGLDLAWLWPVLRIGGIVLLVLLLVLGPFALIAAAKASRRRTRRTQGSPAARIAGGWDEYVDAAVDAGRDAAPDLTRSELAGLFATPSGAALATDADRAVFSGAAVPAADATEFWRVVDRGAPDAARRARFLARRRRDRIVEIIRPSPGALRRPVALRREGEAPGHAARARIAMNTIDDSTAVGLGMLTFLLIVVLYVWTALALSAVFRKSGEQPWKAWVPILNQVVLLQLGGFSGWLFLLILVPFVGPLIVWALLIVACYRINVAFGHGVGMTVLAALVLPVWASILGFGPARWLGTDLAPRGPQGTGPRRTAAPSDDDVSAYVPRATPPAYSPSDPFPAPPLPTAPASGWTPPPVPPAPAAEPASRWGGFDLGAVSEVTSEVTGADSAAPAPISAVPRTAAPAPEPPVAEPWVTPPPVAAPPIAASPVTPPPTTPPPSPRRRSPASRRCRLRSPRMSRGPPRGPRCPRPRPSPRRPGRSRRSSGCRMPAPRGPRGPRSRRSTRSPRSRTTRSTRRSSRAVDAPRGRSSPRPGAAIPLTADVVLLGRKPAPDRAYPDAQLVSIDDGTVSKTHARLALREDHWYVTDLGSTNGVLFATLMGTEVEATPGEEIEAGERFFLGDAEVRLQRSDG